MEDSKLAQLESKSSDVDNIFSHYGQFVLLLESSEPAVEEALVDAEPKHLLKVISTLEDQINDMALGEKKTRERYKKYLYFRQFAIGQLRQRLGVPSSEYFMHYSPSQDHNLLEADSLDFDATDW